MGSLFLIGAALTVVVLAVIRAVARGRSRSEAPAAASERAAPDRPPAPDAEKVPAVATAAESVDLVEAAAGAGDEVLGQDDAAPEPDRQAAHDGAEAHLPAEVVNAAGDPGPTPDSAPVEPDDSPRGTCDVTLVAPVELWVGETRVGVKEGTSTHRLFRVYADSLFSALNEAKRQADNEV